MDFTDEYTHETRNIIYIPQCLPTREVEDLYEYDLEGCACKSRCEVEKCCCVQRSGTTYEYNSIIELNNYCISESAKGPTYECNENCGCIGKNCGNKLVQFGPRGSLQVQMCDEPVKGLGLFTLTKVRKGNFICEYAGEIITKLEASKRFESNTKRNKMNYIFCIKEHFGEKTTGTFIDPTYYGNIGRYINHSCDPNCKLFVVRVTDTVPILGIFANRDIAENSEITYDYGDSGENHEGSGSERKLCHCNSNNCRRYLPFDLNLA